AMTKVIKEEFEKLETLMINDVSLTCDTSLGIFHDEFNQLSNMDNDLFTYEVEIVGIANVPCDLNKDDDSKQQMSQESDDDIKYDPSDDKGDDEVVLTDKESFDSDDEDKVAKIFRIETNMSLLKTLKDLRLMKNKKTIGFMSGIKMCHGCMKNHGLTLDWREDGYCNVGNMPGAYIVGNTIHYQDLEWYEALKDSELKEEALRNKAIMEGLIDEDDESSNNGWRRWDSYEIADHDQEEREYENGHEDKE
ncbi:hypothetical protein Tco_1414254, partial [Tanacetum coccineum]